MSYDLKSKFTVIKAFLVANPQFAPLWKSKKASAYGSIAYEDWLFTKFKSGRDTKKPAPPETQPDIMVKIVLNRYFDVPDSELPRAEELHRLAMGAENIIGDILERYIASKLEPHGLIWCSGSVTKSIDFVCQQSDEEWIALQVKNRDNSENSSSAGVRKGTKIQKWFRTFAKKSGDNWSNFPHFGFDNDLSEEEFRSFAATYLNKIKVFD